MHSGIDSFETVFEGLLHTKEKSRRLQMMVKRVTMSRWGGGTCEMMLDDPFLGCSGMIMNVV